MKYAIRDTAVLKARKRYDTLTQGAKLRKAYEAHMERLYKYYDQMDDKIKAEIPLKKMWMVNIGDE